MSETTLEPVPKAQAVGPRHERLPDTRNSITHNSDISGHEGCIVGGLYRVGRPCELSSRWEERAAPLGGLLDSIGILTSVSFQHGVPLETLVGKCSHCRFEPSGWTKNPEIVHTTSVLDFVLRWLGVTFLADADGTPASNTDDDNAEASDE